MNRTFYLVAVFIFYNTCCLPVRFIRYYCWIHCSCCFFTCLLSRWEVKWLCPSVLVSEYGGREECLWNKKELELGAWQVAHSHPWASCLRTKGDPEPTGHSQGSWGQLAFGCPRKRWRQQGPEVLHRLSTQGALHWVRCPFHITHHPGSGLLSVLFSGAWIPQGLCYSCISPGKACLAFCRLPQGIINWDHI